MVEHTTDNRENMVRFHAEVPNSYTTSSIWQSDGLQIRRFRVRTLGGMPTNSLPLRQWQDYNPTKVGMQVRVLLGGPDSIPQW